MGRFTSHSIPSFQFLLSSLSLASVFPELNLVHFIYTRNFLFLLDQVSFLSRLEICRFSLYLSFCPTSCPVLHLYLYRYLMVFVLEPFQCSVVWIFLLINLSVASSKFISPTLGYLTVTPFAVIQNVLLFVNPLSFTLWS